MIPVLLRGLTALCLAALAACASQSARQVPALSPAPVPAAAPRTLAPRDDWRSLIPVPFGSTVSQVPFALREVLLFQGEPRAQGESDDQECYSKSGSALAFHGYDTDDYVLCFFQERLYRVEAALRLPKDAPADTFTHWCDEWLHDLSAIDRSADHCQGRENDTAFAAGISYDTEIAGPVVKLLAYDAPARENYERRARERTEKAQPPGPSQPP